MNASVDFVMFPLVVCLFVGTPIIMTARRKSFDDCMQVGKSLREAAGTVPYFAFQGRSGCDWV
jgi:hypothetical protein